VTLLQCVPPRSAPPFASTIGVQRCSANRPGPRRPRGQPLARRRHGAPRPASASFPPPSRYSWSALMSKRRATSCPLPSLAGLLSRRHAHARHQLSRALANGTRRTRSRRPTAAASACSSSSRTASCSTSRRRWTRRPATWPSHRPRSRGRCSTAPRTAASALARAR
jgi:hypothetical protein